MVAPGGFADKILADLRTYWEPIRLEYDHKDNYGLAADFWLTYHQNVQTCFDQMSLANKAMQRAKAWPDNPGTGNAASAEFYKKVQAGIDSIGAWTKPTQDVSAALHDLVSMIGLEFYQAQPHQENLLNLIKAGTDPGPQADEQLKPIRESFDRLKTQFDLVTGTLKALPSTSSWQGPILPGVHAPHSTATAAGPGSPSASGGPGAPGNPGGSMAPGGPGDGGASPTETGEAPVSSASASDAETDPSSDRGTSPPSTDPMLAGDPTATMTSLPGNALSGPGSTSAVPGLGPSGSSIGTAGPATHTTPFTLPAAIAAGGRNSAPSPSRRPGSSGADSIPGGEPPEVAPTLSRGAAPGSSGGSGVGGGFYPAMVPPMMGRGAARGGIRPGDAELAGGATIRPGGRDSRRAGLRPQLQGRYGDQAEDDHRGLPAPEPDRAVDVLLDEELWQVPGAAPATPPDQRRRGR